MTGPVSGAMTPRELAERALLGTLLLQPGRAAALDWLRPEDFRTPLNGHIYRHIRNLVDDAGPVTVRVLYTDEPDVVVHSVHSSEVTGAQLRAEQDRTGEYLQLAEVDLPRGLPAERHAEHVRAIIAGEIAPPPDPAEVTAEDIRQQVMVDPDTGPNTDRLAPYLHTLMATAPPAGQAELYATMVLEASIRRDVAEAGMRVAQAQAAAPELGDLLAAVDTALNTVEQTQQRWEALTRGSIQRSLDNDDTLLAARAEQSQQRIATNLDLTLNTPDADETQRAEEAVVGTVLTNRAALAALADRLLPSDFADPQLGNAYRAAVHIHDTSNAGDRAADPVTVAWEQQRQEPVHGPGVPVQRLVELSTDPTVSYAWHAEVVMRASLARLTSHAADMMQRAAQHPGLQPADVLHTSRSAYEAVRTAAERMADGRHRRPQRELDAQTPDWTAASGTQRTVADLHRMRQQSSALLNSTDRDPHAATPNAPVFDLTSRLNPARDPGPEPQ